MTTQPFYNTGTAVLTNGSKNMVGTGTFWAGNIRQFDRVVGADGKENIVDIVVDNTHITLLDNWAGVTQAATIYKIWMSPDEIYLQTLTRAIFAVIQSSVLTGLSGLVPAANNLIYYDASNVAALASLTAFARSILDDAAATNVLTTLGVSTFIKTLLDDVDQATALATLGAQPVNANLSSWGAISRAAGFDALVAGGTSAQLRTFLTDETGTGSAVFATSPTIASPSITGGVSGSSVATSTDFYYQANVITGKNAGFLFSTSGNLRWLFGKSANTESGSNAGSDFTYLAYDDSGSFLGTAFSLKRSNFALSLFGLVDISAAAAGQIKFPATQNPSSDANTLDDYEEGTFTPVIAGTTTAGAGTYSVQVGRYTKIGRLVEVEADLTWSAHTGTGNTRITGLPFTSLSTGAVGKFSIVLDNFTFTGVPSLEPTLNATTADLKTQATAAARAAIAIDTAASLGFSGSYSTT